MRHRPTAFLVAALILAAPASAVAQRLATDRVGVAHAEPVLPSDRLVAPLRLSHSIDAPPSRWPFVLIGALTGGAAAGAWYAYEVSKPSNDDGMMIDLSVPVVGIGVAVGAAVGLLVSEAVRVSRLPAPAP